MGSGLPPGTDLPAPYESPWRRLGSDLRDVVATLRLRLWELLRRNRQGDLWRPRPWPNALAPLFWPLVLGVLLLVPLAVGGRLARHPAPPAALAPPAGPDRSSSAPVASDPLLPDPLAPAPLGSAAEELAPEEPAPVETPPVVPPPVVPAPMAPASEAPESPVPQTPPLLSALADTPGAELLSDARDEPARALLVLQVGLAYGALPAPERAERVQAWWQRAQELGYERLELLGPGNGLLARSALVGGGLVLYEPPPGSAADPA